MYGVIELTILSILFTSRIMMFPVKIFIKLGTP